MSIIKKLTVGATIAAIGVYALSNRKKATQPKVEPELATATAKTKAKPKSRKRAKRSKRTQAHSA